SVSVIIDRPPENWMDNASPRVDNATEPDIVERVIGRALAANSGTIPSAVVGRTKPRPSARDSQSRASIIRVGRPLPNVAQHVVQPDAVRRERTNRSGIEKMIGEVIAPGPPPLPNVGSLVVRGVAKRC